MAKQKRSLLTLPAEIRNRIYEHTFTLPPAPTSLRAQSLGLLRTCRQIRREAHLLAFANTTFNTEILRPGLLIYRLAALEPEQIKAIRSIAFTRPVFGRGPTSAWDGDFRPLLYPVYMQCRRLLWETLKMVPSLERIAFVHGADEVKTEAVEFFFDSIIGSGMREHRMQAFPGQHDAWLDAWRVLPVNVEEHQSSVELISDTDEARLQRAVEVAYHTSGPRMEAVEVERRVTIELVRVATSV